MTNKVKEVRTGSTTVSTRETKEKTYRTYNTNSKAFLKEDGSISVEIYSIPLNAFKDGKFNIMFRPKKEEGVDDLEAKDTVF